jgi:hypothetical protein
MKIYSSGACWFSIVFLCLAQAGVQAAAPLNDNFANRILLSGEIIVANGNNVDATREVGEPFHWNTTGGKSVWWTWTAPNSGLASINTIGSDFDTLLAVYTGSSVSGLTLVTNNDDAVSVQSVVEFDAIANTTYQIAVDGYGVGADTSTGNIVLNITNVTTTVSELVPWGSSWKYLDNGSDQGAGWRAAQYNDSTWATGLAQLGYGDGDEATVVGFGPNANSRYPTTYFRTSFSVEDPSRAVNLQLSLLYDDGGIVYLNGQEVFRSRTMPSDPINYLTFASQSSDNEIASVTLPGSLFVAGVNVLAVEIHQNTGNSSDISFDLRLVGVFETVTNRPPFVAVTGPPAGTTFGAPANITIAVDAFDRETTVTNVEFYVNGNRLGQDQSPPFTLPWNSVPVGAYSLRAVATDETGLMATSAPVNITVSANTAPPAVAAKFPIPGPLTNLTQILVTFSKPVTGVDASDFLVNGTSATAVAGNGSNYVFTFPQPPYGPVAISWTAGHGINDGFIPPNAFNPSGAGATWQYQLNDAVPPAISAINPSPGSIVPALSSVQVTFTETVTGVNAGDLLINSTPAASLSGSGAGPYAFNFSQPAAGTVQITWAPGHGIQDVAGNAFAAIPWSYVLDTNSSGVVISEIMYHPSSESPRHEYIELYNRGGASVNLAGWRFSRGVRFTFPTNAVIPGAGYLVVVADRQSFTSQYPTVTNVIGDWLAVRLTNVLGTVLTNYENKLSDSHDTVELVDAAGQRVDVVPYADEGDWAIRQRGLNDFGFRGWTWKKPADGQGPSLELMNPALANEHGQNWSASTVPGGTPGRANSVAGTDIAPMILEVSHFPLVPKSSGPVSVSARILDEAVSGVSVALHWRVDAVSPLAFAVTNMFDDGLHGDGAAGDRLYGAVLPAMANHTVVEFYVRAVDSQNHERTWPGPAVDAEDLGAGNLGQVANALFQVDDTVYSLNRPLYKIILRASEYNELGNLFNAGPDSDASMNATFISLDGTETLFRHRCDVRNRGHGSRFGSPHNYLVNFPSEQSWKGLTRLNLNARTVYAQHFGSVLLQKAGVVGGNSRAVQLRVNSNAGPGGTPTYGVYAANEPIDNEWANNHFPFDDGGNVYKVVRDIGPPEFDYRTLAAYPGLFGPEDPRSYNFTYFKQSNTGQDDWSDLIGMLRVMGLNGTTPFTTENVRQVVNVEQWLAHIAVMALVDNRESGLNTGFNDDYFLYRGAIDPRFILVFHDLDTILNEGDSSGSTIASIFSATANNGSGQAINRFLHHPEIEPLYYATLQRLIDTVFAPENFNPLIDQTIGDYVPANVTARMKTWNASRVAYVRTAIASLVPARADAATIVGEPRTPTPLTSATLLVGGPNVVAYRYKLNSGAYGPETPVSTPITLSGLANGSSNIVYVIGRNASNIWQSTNAPTVSRAWVVNTAWPGVRLNEVLARNNGAVNHQGTLPDLIELYNEGPVSIDLSGMRLTDDPTDTNKFIFPANTLLASGAYLLLYADTPNGTSGFHVGFSLNQDGEGVFLYGAGAGGALLDSVMFGSQLPDLSIGRVNGGTWQLTKTTPGAPNISQPTGDPATLKINEWLAASQAPFPDDFIELYNSTAAPVDLSGLYLTDNVIGAPRLHPITALSFIPANGYLVFTANGNASDSTILGFGLDADQGEVALLGMDQRIIDCVSYGPQRSGVSRGRCPNGGTNIVALLTPTPGGPNLCPATPPVPVTVNFVPYDHPWKYDQSSDFTGLIWMNPELDDSGWLSGQSVLAATGGGFVSQPVRTALTLGRLTYFFRTTFTLPQVTNLSGLRVSHLFDDGAVVYLNGEEVYRYNMPGGLVNYSTLALQTLSGPPQELGPFNLPLTHLTPGLNYLAVEVHQSAANSSDVFMGIKLDGLIATNSPGQAGLVINEILADNATLNDPDGSTPDWVELYNPSASAVDLSDLSFSDSTTDPRRWVFPSGAFVPAQGYFTIRFDGGLSSSETNTGFGLKTTGDALYLFDRPSRGGGVLDFVTFGLQVPDFSIGRMPNGSSNWNLTLPTLGAANIAATLGDPALLKINEWLADPLPGEDDWFEVYNPNSQPVAIGRFYFSDVLNELTKYQPIRALSFIGAGSNAWQRIWADNNIGAGADHAQFNLRGAGEAIGIANASGALINGVSFGPQSENISEGRLADGAPGIVRFGGSMSPGDPNYLLLTNVVINEVLSHTDLPLEDAIELRNLSSSPLNIGGWFLSDAKSNLRKFVIPSSTTIPANGFKVFYEYQFGNPDTGTPFSFNSGKGDNAYLSEAAGNGELTGYRATAKFGPAENGVSFGRSVNTAGQVDYPPMRQLSFGTNVTAQSPTNQLNAFRSGQGATNPYPKVGPVVISEIMYHPLPVVIPGVATNDNVVEEFIELHNLGESSISLYDLAYPTNTWRLRNAVDFEFAPFTTLSPGGYLLVVSFDPITNTTARASFLTRYGTNSILVGPYRGKLDNGGESVSLYKPDPPEPATATSPGYVPYVLVEQVNYESAPSWTLGADGTGLSLQRVSLTGYGNEPTNWVAAIPTPGPGGTSQLDSDADGMPDGWEDQYGLNKLSSADAGQDADGDGLTNLQEFRAGTDPRNPGSNLNLTATLNGAVVELRFTAIAGRSYTIQYCTSLPAGGAWQKLADVNAQGSTQIRLIPDNHAGGQKFYRLVTPTQP